MKQGRLPTVEELERVYFQAVARSFWSDEEVRFRVDPAQVSKYRPFEVVFKKVRSFTGAKDFSGVQLCIRGPSGAEDGVVFEFETRDAVPPPADLPQLETPREIKARVVAASVAVEEVFRPRARAVSIDFFSSSRRLAELEQVLRGLPNFRVEFVEPEHTVAYTTFTTLAGTIIGSFEGCEARIDIEHGAPPGTYRLTTAYPSEVQEVFLRNDPAWLELRRTFHPRIDALIASIGGTRTEDPD